MTPSPPAARPSLASRRPAALLAGLVLTVAMLFASPPPAGALPPGIPDVATARAQLGALAVRAEGSLDGYSRDLFPHWSTASGTCDTREVVLRRDGTGVTTDAGCRATSGTWFSPYDGVTETSATEIDVDHVVPLAEAWRSGAATWTADRRQAFANSLGTPELLAVTDDVNQAKGDRDPATWQPPRAAFRCTYARLWVGAKHAWQLTLQLAEETALRAMLDTC